MISFKTAINKLKDLDKFLTTLGGLLKKHWFLLILILVGWFFYYALTTPLEELEGDNIEYNEEI